MRLYKIVAHNFKQYGPNTEIIFPEEGLIGIIGKNGEGKSTLLEIIAWVLYSRLKGSDNSDIMNKSASPKDECYCELYFTLNGEYYLAKRHLTKTNECFIRKSNGETFAQTKSYLTSYVSQNLFKMDFDAFMSCYYAEQDDFDNLTKLTPTKRVQTVSKLLNINSIDKAAENTRREYNELKVEIEKIQSVMFDEDSIKLSIQNAKNEKDRLNNVLADIESKLSASTELYKNVLLEKSTMDADYLTYNQLKNNAFAVKSQIETLLQRSLNPSKEELAKLQSLKDRYDAIVDYKQLYPALNSRKESMENERLKFQQANMLKTEVERINNQILTLEGENNRLKDTLSSFDIDEDIITSLTQKSEEIRAKGEAQRTIAQELTFEKKSIEKEISHLNSIKNKFDALGADSPCPSCERPLGEHYITKIEEITSEIEKATEKIEEINGEISKEESLIQSILTEFREVDKEIANARTQLRNKQQAEQQFSNSTKNLENAKGLLTQKEEALANLGVVEFDEQTYKDLVENVRKARNVYDEIISMENSIQKIPQIEDTIEEVEAEIQNLADQGIQFKNQLVELNFSESVYAELNEKANRINVDIDMFKNEKSNILIQLANIEKDIEHFKDKLEMNKSNKDLISTKRKEASLLKALDASYKEFKSNILAQIAPTLSETMSDYIEIMSNGKYNQVELDKEYNIYIFRNGLKHPLPFYSGGEKKLAALCLRLAITSLLVQQNGQAEFNMIAMDEVFGSMDNERQDSIIEMFRNLRGKFEQIFIVSHSENVKESFDHLLEIYRDSNGFSKARFLTDTDLSATESILETYVI